MRVQVKVCGLTTPEEAAAVAEAGADAVGLVFFARSLRAVDLETARRVAAALPPFVARVGVFVDASRDELLRAADSVPLDLLQLHGREPLEALAGLPRRSVKALGVTADFDLEQALRYAGRCDALLLDTGGGSLPGGSGATFDWSVARAVRARVPRLVLAGGLDPGNVGAALAAVGPDAVDVSSGVESAPGRKDLDKVRAFIAAVRAASEPAPSEARGPR
jgi:phosphoribosylanthranilate isomerase